MFNISILQYLIFFIIAIPPFVIGWYKGWKSGLFTLLLTFVSGGILTGIAIGIYDSLLWPIFRYVFLQNQSNGTINTEALKEISKLSIIVFSVGIILLPVVGLNYLIYLGFSRLLNKYMNPVIKKIAPNKVEMTTKNLFVSRLGGVALNGITGLIVAATITNAVATLTTNSRSSNIFNSFTSAIGKSITFGQGTYDYDYQKIYEFLGDAKDYRSQILRFNNVFNVSGNYSVNEFDMFENDKDFLEKINEFSANSERQSKALILLFLNAVENKGKLNLVGEANFSEEVALESLTHLSWDAKLLDDDDKIVNGLIGEFNFGANHLSLDLNKQGVHDAVEEFYNKRFIPFNDTSYAKQNNEAIAYLLKLNETLNKKINEKIDKNKKLIVLNNLIEKQELDIELQEKNLNLQKYEIIAKYPKLNGINAKISDFQDLLNNFNFDKIYGYENSEGNNDEVHKKKLIYDSFKEGFKNNYDTFQKTKDSIDKNKTKKGEYIEDLSTLPSVIDNLGDEIKTWENKQKTFSQLVINKQVEYNNNKEKIIDAIVTAIL